MSKGSTPVVKFMTMSCCTAAFYGVATLFAPWSMAKTMMFPASAVATEESFNAFIYNEDQICASGNYEAYDACKPANELRRRRDC